jgi:hypothetical protein
MSARGRRTSPRKAEAMKRAIARKEILKGEDHFLGR